MLRMPYDRIHYIRKVRPRSRHAGAYLRGLPWSGCEARDRNEERPVCTRRRDHLQCEGVVAGGLDFCGACHRTPVDVAAFMPANMGIATLRFQPYRLERSLCWGQKGDARITCVACHDPHQPLVRNLAAYDAKCLKCHASTGSSPSATLIAGCTVGKKDCASCHMPKYEIPAVHAKFTDHYIRIVRPGTGFLP